MEIESYFSEGVKGRVFFHAYILIGPKKRTAEALQYVYETCMINQADVIEVVSSLEEGRKGEISIEAIRNAIHEVNLTPIGLRKVLVIHDSNRLSNAAANALLKTIEEPPAHAMVILLSETDSLLSTIQSRCRVVKFYQDAPVAANFSLDFIQRDFGTISKTIEKMVKQNEVNNFLVSLEIGLRNKMLRQTESSAVAALQSLYRAKRLIAANANTRLVLENLILLVRDEVELLGEAS